MASQDVDAAHLAYSEDSKLMPDFCEFEDEEE
jgi:hypothetical protein